MGSGFRTFTAGEVLTASNVQNYLMDQSVMVFGGSAARSSAIGTANFEEGMVSYLTDTDKVEAYNGTNWVSVAPTTSQGLTLINTTSFSGVASASAPANTFTSTYENYKIVFNIDFSASQEAKWRLRASGSDNTTNNYNSQNMTANNTTFSTQRFLATSAYLYWFNASWFYGTMELQDPQQTNETMYQLNGSIQAGGDAYGPFVSGYFGATDAFDSITIFPASGTMTGSFSVYGYNK